MRKLDTRIGVLFFRDKDDERVYHEVVVDDEYRRWGSMEIAKGSIVVDAGAHAGYFSKLASTLGGYVYALEPEAENYKMLKTNMRARDSKLLNVALGNGKPMKFLVDGKRSDLHKLDPSGKVSVPTMTLEALMEKYWLEHIDLLKMDIEGAEYDVLYNTKCLEKIRQITMEWHYGSSKMAELILFLEKRGFTVVWLGGNGQWGKLQLKRL